MITGHGYVKFGDGDVGISIMGLQDGYEALAFHNIDKGEVGREIPVHSNRFEDYEVALIFTNNESADIAIDGIIERLKCLKVNMGLKRILSEETKQ